MLTCSLIEEEVMTTVFIDNSYDLKRECLIVFTT